jgi:hypothetical protein
MAYPGGVFQDMKIVPLLIFWSLPLLPAGGLDDSPACSCRDRLHAEHHDSSAVIQSTRDVSFPDDPGGSLGSSLWDEDEEDSVEDMFFDTGTLLSGALRYPGQDDLCSLIRSRHDLFRIPSHPHPLRC